METATCAADDHLEYAVAEILILAPHGKAFALGCPRIGGRVVS